MLISLVTCDHFFNRVSVTIFWNGSIEHIRTYAANSYAAVTEFNPISKRWPNMDFHLSIFKHFTDDVLKAYSTFNFSLRWIVEVAWRVYHFGPPPVMICTSDFDLCQKIAPASKYCTIQLASYTSSGFTGLPRSTF